MIVVRLEIWPYGSYENRSEIGRAYIWNDGTELSPHYGNYGVAVMKPEDLADLPAWITPLGRGGGTLGTGFVPRYPRGPLNLWPLVRDALRACKLRRVKTQPPSHGELGILSRRHHETNRR